MSCNKEVVNHRGIRCAINPRLGRERDYNAAALRRDGAGRCVPVIGGGPAGMQAAIVLAERGFRPILFERRAYLGGSAVLASGSWPSTSRRRRISSPRSACRWS